MASGAAVEGGAQRATERHAISGKAGGAEGLTTAAQQREPAAAQQREPAASRGTFAEGKPRTATVGRARSDLRRSRKERSFFGSAWSRS